MDPKCRELAEHFLPTNATDRLKQELAQHIQQSIESWVEDERDRLAQLVKSGNVATKRPI